MPQKQYLDAGQIVGTHGVRGEMRVQSWCDSIETFCSLKKVYLDAEGKTSAKVKSRPQKTVALMKMEGVDSIPEAEALRNTVLYLDRKDLKLPKDVYFIQDIIGLKAIDADTGLEYGTVTDVSETGANDVYHIQTVDGIGGKPSREVLIPAVPLVVKEIQIEDGVMLLTPIKGLFDDEN